MADKRTKARNMRLLHDTLIYTLNEKERRQFTVILSEFQSRRNRTNFVLSLRRLLETPKKQEVVPYLIGILPIREREHFLNLWMQTSQYNAFYSLGENRVSKTIRSPGPVAYDNAYNSYPVHQRGQGRFNNNRPLQRLSPSYGKVKRSSTMHRPLSNLSKNRLSSSLPSLRSATLVDRPLKTHQISLKRDSKTRGFGFSIRGGAEHGLGIFVSSVDKGSVADRKNLMVGDQIIKLNEYNFQNIDSSKAIKIIQQKKKIRMLVFSSSMVPGSRVAHVEYQWVDTNGRPSSPPVNFRKSIDGIGRSRSIGDICLLEDDDERRVVVHVPNNAHLGLRIRGGTEYGIGVFVSSVDRNQVAERAGIRAGDQIIDVNGIDFQEISHRDAVRILKAYKMMSMLLRHIGKIPYAKTSFEKTEWLDSARTSRSSSVISIAQDRCPSTSPEKSKFRQGIAGSQLLHQSTVVVPAHRRIEEQARLVLNEKELVSLKYYISQYIQGEIHMEGLVASLFHLFDSSAKISLFNDIRTVIFPHEIDSFDRLVLEKEIEARKNLDREPFNNGSSTSRSQTKATSDSRSPRIPAKAISYKQLKSPKQQVTSRIPWSPPNTPVPSIPTIERVVSKDEIQIHMKAPIIHDLDFEEDEEDSYTGEDDGEDLRKNLMEDFAEAMMEETDVVNLRRTNEIGNVYEEIEASMQLAADDSEQIAEWSVQPSRRHIQTEFDAIGKSCEQSDGERALIDSISIDSVNHNGAHESNEDKNSSNIGISLMRSALIGSTGRDSTLGGIEEEHERYDLDLKELSVGSIKERGLSSGNSSDSVANDIMAMYAKPDKIGIRTNSGDVEATSDIFRPKFIPSERLIEIPEIDVSPSRNKNGEVETGDDADLNRNSREEIIVAKDTETLLQSSPLSWSNYPESTEPDKRFESVNISLPKDNKEIVNLGELVGGIRIDEADEKPSGFRNDDEAMTLEELENIGADLEFEFEDEQEVVELDEIDKGLLSLKFAPIHEQETAPSTPIVNQSDPSRDEKTSDTEERKTTNGNKARAVNIYEYENDMPRSFAFPSLSGSNRRQMFDVQNIPATGLAGFDGFHSFSPRILTRVDMSNGSHLTKESDEVVNEDSDAVGVRRAHIEENGSEQERAMRMESRPGFERGLSDDALVTFPNRNLSNKRIPIISYRSDSPEKKQNRDHEPAENRSKGPENSENYENSNDTFTFHKLRNIFENEQPGTPRTEYLSEIIKKNNTEGRRRFKSSESVDENANEVELKSSVALREGLRRFKNWGSADENGNEADLKSSAIVGQQASIDGREHNSVEENRSNKKTRNYRSFNGSSPLSATENDLSSFDDFDFSSSITKSMMPPFLSSQMFDDKMEISSGYDSEDYSPGNENSQRKAVRIEKGREELGIVLETSKKRHKGIQIKEILNGEMYAACQYPQLQVGQEVLSIDGESLVGLGVKIATISMNRAYSNPSGRFLEIIVITL